MKARNWGILPVDRVGDRGSYAILAQFFSRPHPVQYKNRRGGGSWAQVQLSGNYVGLEPEWVALPWDLPAVWEVPP